MIVITGSSGFIGRNLINLLKESNIKFKTIKTLDIEKKNIRFFKEIKSFVHLGYDIKKYKKYNKSKVDRNVRIIKYIIKKAEIYKFQIIFPSTASFKFWGKKKKISKKIYPINQYALSKINCEKLLKNSYKSHKTNITILRIFNVYGKKQSKGWLIPDLMHQIFNKTKKNLVLINYCNTRDFIHVSDVCEAIFKSLSLKGFNILNVGTSVETKLIDLVYLMKKIFKFKKKIILLNKHSKNNRFSKADISNTKKILSWKPKVILEKGLIDCK